MTSHLNSHRTTDIKPEMLSGVQTGNGTPHDKYSICGYAALPMREQTERTTFSCKDDLCKTLHLYWSGVKRLIHWRSTHGDGHIPLCGIFSYCLPVFVKEGVIQYPSFSKFILVYFVLGEDEGLRNVSPISSESQAKSNLKWPKIFQVKKSWHFHETRIKKLR